jgi:hypothetical protein
MVRSDLTSMIMGAEKRIFPVEKMFWRPPKALSEPFLTMHWQVHAHDVAHDMGNVVFFQNTTLQSTITSLGHHAS